MAFRHLEVYCQLEVTPTCTFLFANHYLPADLLSLLKSEKAFIENLGFGTFLRLEDSLFYIILLLFGCYLNSEEVETDLFVWMLFLNY